jgi:hypothetical protein
VRDLPKFDLRHISVRDLRVLLEKARASGRVELANLVSRELSSRTGRAGPGVPYPKPEAPSHGRRKAALGYATAAVVAVLSASGVYLSRDVWQGLLPPAEGDIRQARGPDASQASSPTPAPRADVALAPDPDASAPAAAPVTPRRLARSSRDAPPLDREDERTIQPPAQLQAAAPQAADVTPRGTGSPTRLAVSQSTAGAALDCDLLVGSERMVCEDARRATVNPRLARLSNVPVRVNIVGGVGRPAGPWLAAPGASRPNAGRGAKLGRP